MHSLAALSVLLLLALTSCNGSGGQVKSALLDGPAGPEFEALRGAFAAANPGYDIAWHPDCTALEARDTQRVAFVQGPATRSEQPTVGDILLLRAGEGWAAPAEASIDLLVFEVPHPIPDALPSIVRPDWDPRITDTPGGCAEETGAYRRILLTWLEEKGPYVLHALNAHRVRITDSFSHYHPVEGGFDELYLVQMSRPGARVLTSERVPEIEERSIHADELDGLLQTTELEVGHLVYLPRGTMHRGVGGALVQVISVPGFVPNSEIGLDHHLRAINEKLGLAGDEALPFHEAASHEAVVK